MNRRLMPLLLFWSEKILDKKCKVFFVLKIAFARLFEWKIKSKFLQELFEHVFVNDVHQPAQVKGSKHQAHISRRSFYSSFGGDKIKAPLPFYNTIGMFNDGLPSFINLGMLFNVLPVLIHVRLVFTTFNKSSFFVFGTQGQCRAAFARTRFIMLYMIDVALLAFPVLRAIGVEYFPLRTGIRVAFFTVNELIKVVPLIRSKGSNTWNGYHQFYTHVNAPF